MRYDLAARPSRALVPLITLSLLAVGVQASSSHANPPAQCDQPTVATVAGGEASNTLLGGTVLRYTISCTGNSDVTETVAATYGTQTVFKSVASKLVNGKLLETIEIHLPASVQQVCVTIGGSAKCTP